MPLTDEQSNQLQQLMAELQALALDPEAAEAVLDEMYLLATRIYERFPDLELEDE